MIKKLNLNWFLVSLLIIKAISDDCINMWDTEPLESYANMCPGSLILYFKNNNNLIMLF